MASFKNFFQVAQSRKLIRTVTIYLSSSITTLGVVELFSKHYNLSSKVFDVLLAVLVFGLPASLIFAWFHGARERQRFQKKEIATYLILFILAAAISVKIIGTPAVLKGSSEEKSIAVLPFQNLSDSKEDEYFSDGVTEDIITNLAQIGDLTVISRTSVMPYKNTQKSILQIGKELNVATILEGSVRRESGRVRIVGQLIDARSDKHLWAETYNRQMTDIFAIQSEVAARIASALKATLSPDEKQRLKKKATENVDAYAYYIRGRDYYYKYTKEDNERAIELFKKALELDSNYALAYAGLGDAYSWRWRFGFPAETLDTAIEMSRKAISLDPELAEGYKALGLAQESKGYIKEGLDSYYKAVELNPNYAPVVANIGAINFSRGKYDEALKWMRKTVELQPGFARYYSLVGLQYHYLGFDNLARVWLERALEFQPDFIFPQMVLAYIDLYAGKIKEARERMAKVLSSHPEDQNALNTAGDVELTSGNYKEAGQYYDQLASLTSLVGPPGNKLAYVLLKTGDSATATKVFNIALPAYLENPSLDTEGSPLRFYIAEVYSLQKKKAEALDWLKKAIDIGYSDRWMTVDPLLENIRSEPRFKEIMDSLQTRLDKMRQQVKEQGLDK